MNIKELTSKEEEIMSFFWEEGKLFVKQIVEKYDDPKPHFNTISTYVRTLEEKGFLSHESFGSSYQYFPVISKEDYHNRTLKNVIKKYFGNSYLNVVNTFIKSENLSVDEIRKLLDDIDRNNKN
ncbi:BlaI/MecI/CopY family transcriptional regulator [Capnocytophaga cynodegmi]|uniref:Transcriptional regulator n=1 Tax=Capnocytophaga cynodegmi TaxID=28189 RepID=A0A286NU35_9FLAO|nr:BlaI/MecI/CopY family transcriptional regulator [Capnocytophaga cynodegmi]ATA67680.1 transcriptional regulator [Capnocytophaga cynodegmi]